MSTYLDNPKKTKTDKLDMNPTINIAGPKREKPPQLMSRKQKQNIETEKDQWRRN